MRPLYNVYCDESCHLENDSSNTMVLGAVWCSEAKKKEIFDRIKEIKEKHGLKKGFEIKWNKVSASKVAFYKELIDYFFDDDDLHFRALIVPNKSSLDHAKFAQTHDTFYYKMFFDLLKVILEPDSSYNIYLDIKDTNSEHKIQELQNILRHNHYDYSKQILKRIQQVRSHEVAVLQLTDLLIGAIGYVHRELSGNKGKLELIEKLKKRSGYTLTHSTLYKENKLNLFIWKGNTAQ
ncbi:MAG: DUF3800 domain-containing protein [Chitinophagaceae bacterium]|nr:DUF3800 domain-containing protein [Chitinophagaceae bacterium]